MTSVIALAQPLLAAAATTKTKSSGGSSLFLVFLIAIAIAGYFFFLRPQQQKARKQRAMQSDIAEGDEVVTVGGIVGRVLKLEGDRVHLLTGHHSTPELGDHLPHRMTFVRNAISRKVDPPAAETPVDEDDAFEDEDEDGYTGNGHGELSSIDGFAGNGYDERDLEDEPAGGASSEGTAPGDVSIEDAAPAASDDDQPGKGRGRQGQGGTRRGTSS